MPDEPKSKPGETPEPKEGETPEGERKTEPKEPTLDEVKAELTRTAAALKEANAESAKRRKRLEQLEQDEQKRREAEMSETDKLKKRTEDAEAKRAEIELEWQALKLRVALQRAIRKLKTEFASDSAEEDAYDHLLRVVAFDDGGEIKGLDDALKALQKERGYLFRSETAQTFPPRTNARDTGRGEQDAEKRRLELLQRFPRLKH